MRAGKLDRTIAIERLTTAPDDYGVEQETWTPIATLRAQLLRASRDERQHGAGASDDGAATFRVRYLAGLTLADRIIFEGEAYDVQGLTEIGRRRGLDIRAVARGAS